MHNRAGDVIGIKGIILALSKTLSDKAGLVAIYLPMSVDLTFVDPLTAEDLTATGRRFGDFAKHTKEMHGLHFIVHRFLPFRALPRVDRLVVFDRFGCQREVNVDSPTGEHFLKLVLSELSRCALSFEHCG